MADTDKRKFVSGTGGMTSNIVRRPIPKPTSTSTSTPPTSKSTVRKPIPKGNSVLVRPMPKSAAGTVMPASRSGYNSDGTRKTSNTRVSTTIPPDKPPRKVTKTKGGAYPVYSKGSSGSESFRSAFKSAKQAGKSTFTWEGRKYSTKVKRS